MALFKNRIGLSLLLITLGTYVWEFHIKPVSGPFYTGAVREYKSGRYQKSLDLLQRVYDIDPNNTGILTLMGWNYLKTGRVKLALEKFRRAHGLDPAASDTLLGYADTEIQLKHYDDASRLLRLLGAQGVATADVRMAWGEIDRHTGRNRDAAREFEGVLALRHDDSLALKSLQELYNLKGSVPPTHNPFKPVVRPPELTCASRVSGSYFARLVGGAWKTEYLTGVDLTAAVPGHFPADSVTDPDVYGKWLDEISRLGVNTLFVATIQPPAFYHALAQFNAAPSHNPLGLFQGIAFERPPANDDLFQADYYQACREEIEEAVDVIHGQGDVGSNYLHSGGLYPYDVARWVRGFIVGNTWLSHVVLDNDRLNPDIRSFRGNYIKVASGNPTEVFLGEMIDHLAAYEQDRYNWQHPVAFLSWPTLDPMRHPTESSMGEEIAIRRSLGELVSAPAGPFDDDDSVTVDPTHLKATGKFVAGYFAAYNVFPFYPDFLNLDPGYLKVFDREGANPFLGYLKDLKAHTSYLPLLVSAYGVPSSLGIGHFSPAGFNEGGNSEGQQGKLLARFTRNIYDAGAAGGMVFEWLDEWFRQSWVTRNYETPKSNKPRWANLMDPMEYYGLVAADSSRRSVHLLAGDLSEWEHQRPLYSEAKAGLVQPVGDSWDRARDLKALYVDADESFLYLRLVVDKLADDKTGRPNWGEVNYLIGIGTDPGQAGLTYLPFIAPVRFPQGMTYALQLAGPAASHIWIASTYNPYKIVPVAGLPTETRLAQKLGWTPELRDSGTFESEIIEPNRRRFGRDGKYYPAERYDRGVLRYGTLDTSSKDYDSLAEWHANVATNTLDLRIPWALLNVTDPSTLQIFAGLEKDGTVKTVTTPGFVLAAFSYRPVRAFQVRPIMEQGHPVADSLPVLSGPLTMAPAQLRTYLWKPWTTPAFKLREKSSWKLLHGALLALPQAPPSAAGSKAISGGRL